MPILFINVILCILFILPGVWGCNWPFSNPDLQGGLPVPSCLRPDNGNVSFVTDYTTGLELARQWEKPVLLLFTASWCPFSQQMLRETFRDPQVARLSKQFICIQVDVEQNPTLASRHQVRAVPAMAILSCRGVPLALLNGPLSAKEMVDQMHQSIQLVATGQQPKTTRQ